MKYLDHNEKRKSSDLKRTMKDINQSVAALEEVESILENKLISTNREKCYRLCKDVSVSFHKLAGEVLHAKILWAEGLQDESLRELESAAYMSNTKMTAYFQLLEYLEIKKDYKTMKAIGKELIIKCKNPQVPSNVWIKAHIFYSKILVKNGQYTRAIILLKCFAKVFPIPPHINVPYTKKLQEAIAIQDLNQASVITRDSIELYNFGSPRNSYYNITNRQIPQSLKSIKSPFFRNNREFIFKFLDEEAAPQPEAGDIVVSHEKKKVAHFSDVLKSYSGFKKFSNLAIKTEEDQDFELMDPIPIMTPTHTGKSAVSGFSVSSDPIFLYKIGKYTAQHKQNPNDGLCAIEDYLTLLKYEKKESFRENAACKALYWKAILLYDSNQIELAFEIASEILPQLQNKNFSEKYENLQNIISSLPK